MFAVNAKYQKVETKYITVEPKIAQIEISEKYLPRLLSRKIPNRDKLFFNNTNDFIVLMLQKKNKNSEKLNRNVCSTIRFELNYSTNNYSV